MVNSKIDPHHTTRESLRRIIEQAYLYAWGAEGTIYKRADFKENYARLSAQSGYFLYNGDGKFTWRDKA